jgi:hypothetical protein
LTSVNAGDGVTSIPPLPPPVDVIVEKTEFEPFVAPVPGPPSWAPPAPTVTGYVPADTVTPVGLS